MNRFRSLIAIVFVALLAGCAAPSLSQFDAEVGLSPLAPPVFAAPRQSDSGLVIMSPSELPDGYPHRRYEYQFVVLGNVSNPHWRLERGSLPPGLTLGENGLLRGQPESAGEFRFTLAVRGSGGAGVQKGFALKILSALVVNWKSLAHVEGNRIEGSVEVTNTSPDDIDLTFVVMAIAPNGRATAIGYQHFLLTRGTTEMELPFGDSLPRGGYVVNVDAIGEVARRKLIYRERLQTPDRLQVNVGP